MSIPSSFFTSLPDDFFQISAGLEVQSVYRVCDVTIRKGLAVPVIMNEDDPWPPRFTKQPEIGSKINGYVLLDCFGDAAFPCFVVSPGDNLVSQKFGFRGAILFTPRF